MYKKLKVMELLQIMARIASVICVFAVFIVVSSMDTGSIPFVIGLLTIIFCAIGFVVTMHLGDYIIDYNNELRQKILRHERKKRMAPPLVLEKSR